MKLKQQSTLILSILIYFIAPAISYAAGFSVSGDLNTTRRYSTTTLLPTGTVLIAGGTSPSNQVLDSVEIYDPGFGKWRIAQNMFTARPGHTATLMPNGKVLMAGAAITMASTTIIAMLKSTILKQVLGKALKA